MTLILCAIITPMRKDIAVVTMDAALIAATNGLTAAQKASFGSIKLPSPAFYNTNFMHLRKQ